MNRRFRRARLLLAAASVAAAVLARPEPTRATGGSESALALCHQAGESSGSEREELLDRSLEMAERAVEAKPKSARAHLAKFCGLGTQLKDDGIGFSTISKLRTLTEVIDRAMELDPDDPDILAAKGAMLLELPGMFGGDTDKAQQLLRRALSLDPDNQATREYLVKALEAGGRYRLAELVQKAGASAIAK